VIGWLGIGDGCEPVHEGVGSVFWGWQGYCFLVMAEEAPCEATVFKEEVLQAYEVVEVDPFRGEECGVDYGHGLREVGKDLFLKIDQQ